MAPEHPDVLRLAAGTEHEQAVRDYVNKALTEYREERGDAEREKTGVPLGPHASSTPSTASGSRCGSPTTC